MKYFYALIALMVLSSSVYAQKATLYAGTPKTSGYNPTSVHKDSAMFNNPYGIAFDSYGNMWISEWTSHTIRVITPNGQVYTKAGAYNQDCFKNAAATTSRFSNPSGLCVGRGDTVFIADQGNHVIRWIEPYKGQIGYANWVGVKAGKYSEPSVGNPYCYTKHPGHKDGPDTLAQFNEPVDVVSDKNGNLYVADMGNHCIRKIDRNGYVTTIAGIPGNDGDIDGSISVAKFRSPVGVVVDDNGDIYVTEWGNAKLRKISNGTVSTVLEFPPLFNPSDVIRDIRGTMYISDLARIIKFENNKWSIFVGSEYHNGPTGYVNDTGYAARFDRIVQMANDPVNYKIVYAADYNNHVIRRIEICDPYKVNVSITGLLYFCEGDQVVFTVPDGYLKYQWSTGDTTRSVTVKKSEKVSLIVTNADLCPGYSDTFNVTVFKLKPQVVATKTAFCAGDSAILVGQAGFNYYKWYKNGIVHIEGATRQTIAVYDSGLYKLEVISGPCEGVSDEIKIRLGQLIPTLNYEGNQILCQGDSFIVEPLDNFPNYQWKKGSDVISTNKSIVVKESGTYTLYVSNAAACDGTSLPLIVTVQPKPSKPVITTTGDSVLKSSAMSGNQWYRNDTLLEGSTAQGYYASISGWYKVRVTNQYGCFSESDPFPFGNPGINEAKNLNNTIVYPNPTKGKFTMKANIEKQGDMLLRLTDILGKEIIIELVPVSQGIFVKEINLLGYPKGIYVLSINLENELLVRKVVLE